MSKKHKAMSLTPLEILEALVSPDFQSKMKIELGGYRYDLREPLPLTENSLMAVSRKKFLGSDQNDLISVVYPSGSDGIKAFASKIYAGDGDDIVIGNSIRDVILGGAGDDYIFGASGKDRLEGNEGNDTLFGGNDRDFLFGGEGDDMIFGGQGADLLRGGDGDDIMTGGRDFDMLYGEMGDDISYGGGGRDVLQASWGNDQLYGGVGRDRLIAFSDAGEPEIAMDPEMDRVLEESTFGGTSDIMVGGKGGDSFIFRLRLNATEEVVKKHANEAGVIDWASIMSENESLHDHWVDSIGHDVILDYSKSEKDKIWIQGHTVGIKEISYSDSDGDGVNDTTHIRLFSDQRKMVMEGHGGHEMMDHMMKLSHHGDDLGMITVHGDLVERSDIWLQDSDTRGVVKTVDEWMDLFA